MAEVNVTQECLPQSAMGRSIWFYHNSILYAIIQFIAYNLKSGIISLMRRTLMTTRDKNEKIGEIAQVKFAFRYIDTMGIDWVYFVQS